LVSKFGYIMEKFFQDKHVKKTLESKMRERHVKIEDHVATIILVIIREADNHANA